MLNDRSVSVIFKCTLAVVVMCVICFYARSLFIRPCRKEFVLSTHESYYVYEDIDNLIYFNGEYPSQYLPSTAKDIWVSYEGNFGNEDWQVSCIVDESELRNFFDRQPNLEVSLSDVFGMNSTSYKMCNRFYRKRIENSSNIAEDDPKSGAFLECCRYDEDTHWHLKYCYDRENSILSCDFGR